MFPNMWTLQSSSGWSNRHAKPALQKPLLKKLHLILWGSPVDFTIYILYTFRVYRNVSRSFSCIWASPLSTRSTMAIMHFDDTSFMQGSTPPKNASDQSPQECKGALPPRIKGSAWCHVLVKVFEDIFTNVKSVSWSMNQCTVQKKRSSFFKLDCLLRRASKWKMHFLVLFLKFGY